MPHDVFLSYSSKDRLTADAACHYLEHNGVRVWMAPRDILPSMSWAASIVQAINTARVMVLIVSSNANTSPQIEREVERAINKGVPVLPFRVEDVSLNDALEYFLSAPHWLDAFDPPMERHLESLTLAVWQLLQTDYVQHGSSASARTAPPPASDERTARQHPEAVAVVQEAVETATRPPPPPRRDDRVQATPQPREAVGTEGTQTPAKSEVPRGASAATTPRGLRAPAPPNARGALFMTKVQRRTVLRLLFIPVAILVIAASVYGFNLYRHSVQAQAMARMQALVSDAPDSWQQGFKSGLLLPDPEGARYDKDLTGQHPAFLIGAIAEAYAQDDGPDCGPEKISVTVTQASCSLPAGGSLVVRSNLMPDLIRHPPKTVYGPNSRPMYRGVELADYQLISYMNQDLGCLDVEYRVGVASKADRQVISLLVGTLTQLHDLNARIQAHATPSMLPYGRRAKGFTTLEYKGWVGGNEKLGLKGCVVSYDEHPGQYTTLSLVCYQPP